MISRPPAHEIPDSPPQRRPMPCDGSENDALRLVVSVLGEARGGVEHGILGAGEHAVEAAQHHEGQHDAPVFGLLEIASQQFGDRPDQCGEPPNLRCVSHQAPLLQCRRMLHRRSARANRKTAKTPRSAVAWWCWRSFVLTTVLSVTSILRMDAPDRGLGPRPSAQIDPSLEPAADSLVVTAVRRGR